MSNQIAERTINSCYVIKVQNGHIQILCGKENSVDKCLVLLRTELQQTYSRQAQGFVSLHEGRMSLAA